jgi:hypothetical protein
MLLASFVGTFASFVLGVVDPRVENKAGPDWLWQGGRDDIVRNLFFRSNGSFRRYGRPALALTFILGSAALYWIVHRI